jgi:ABC-2 type transport system permease protein
MRAGFLRYATYRQAILAGLVTNTVFGFLRTAVVLTVFTGSARVAGYDPASAVTFVWVGQGLLAVVMIFGDGELASRVRTGQLSDLASKERLRAFLAGVNAEHGPVRELNERIRAA